MTTAALEAFRNYPNVAELGVGQDDLNGVGIDRSPFLHHLAASSPTDPNFVNLWAAASLFISAALGWVSCEPPTVEALKVVQDAVNRVSPNTDCDKLLFRARYSDPDLLRLASLVNQGIEVNFS